MTYYCTIAGTRFESATDVADAFLAVEAEPCTSVAEVEGVVDDLMANHLEPDVFEAGDRETLVAAFADHYGLS